MAIKRSIAGLIIVLVILAAAMPLQVSLAQNIAASGSASGARVSSENTCQTILAKALTTLENTCSAVSRNTACYGNNNVQVQPAEAATIKFDTVGDTAPIKGIKTLFTTPLDMDKGTWGLSLLKLQANIPDSLPGQNVLFLVYGDTKVENASGDMQAFYFSSGLGTPSCKEAPRDGILVKSPQHTEVTFTANGAQVTIASTVVLSAASNGSMKVLVMDGHAKVVANGNSQVLHQGESVNVPLGGANGLTASGGPSEPENDSNDAGTSNLNTTADKTVDPDAPVNVTLKGKVASIKGNHIVVNDMDLELKNPDGSVTINVGSAHGLKDLLDTLEVGDEVDLSGYLLVPKDNNGNGNVFYLVKFANHGKDGHSEKSNSTEGKVNHKGGNGKSNGGMGGSGGGQGGGKPPKP